MRKRGIRVLIGLVLIVIAFIVAGTGAMLAFFVLFGVGAVIVLTARLYPSNRALEDQHDREDQF